MPAPRVRGDYDQLKQIAQSFQGQADTSSSTLQALKQHMQTLQGGDWIGKGADAFYQEMNSAVLPSMQRLTQALSRAAAVTQQMGQIVKQAEEEAARVLNGPSGSGAGAATAGVVGGPVEREAAAQKAAQDAVKSVVGDNIMGNVLGTVAGAVLGSVAAGPTGRMLSNFSPGVMTLAEKSPTLAAELARLEQTGGWTIKYDPTSSNYFTDFDNKIIVINSSGQPKDIVAQLAHEVGHADFGNQFVPATATMTKAEFSRLNVAGNMRSEGAAQLNAATVRAEVRAAGGADPGIPGSQTAAYQTVYNDFKASRITRDQAIDRMGTLMGNEIPSGSTKPYRDHYKEAFDKFWDDNVAPTRRSP